MKPRLILASLGLILLGMVMVLNAGEQSKQAAPNADKEELAIKEMQLARQFEEFQLLLLKLKQRMDRGTADEQNRTRRSAASSTRSRRAASRSSSIGWPSCCARAS